MKKIVILIALAISAHTINAQQYDLIINGVGLWMREVYGGHGDYIVTLPTGGTILLEQVKKGVRDKMRKLEIPECDYEAFESNNGMYILMAKNKEEWYNIDCGYSHAIFKLFKYKSMFDLEVNEKIRQYEKVKQRQKQMEQEMEHKRAIANSLGF